MGGAAHDRSADGGGVSDLDTRLLAAHAEEDGTALIALYAEAAEAARANGDTGRAAFYLTHAWIFALEAGDPRAREYHCRLVAAGRAD